MLSSSAIGFRVALAQSNETTQRSCKFIEWKWFTKKLVGAKAQQLMPETTIAQSRKNNHRDACGLAVSAQAFTDRRAITAGHPNIHNDYVRSVRQCLGVAMHPVEGADHVNVIFAQLPLNCARHIRIVIDAEDRGRLGIATSR